MKQKFAT